MTCSQCGNPNPDGSRFCGTCGKALCSNCGAVVAGSPAFCSVCGHPFRQTATAPLLAPLQSEDEWDPFAAAKQSSGVTASYPVSPGLKAVEPAPEVVSLPEATTEKISERREVSNGERSRRWLRPLALVAAILLAALGFYLLQVHTRTTVIPVSVDPDTAQMVPNTQQAAQDKHVVPHQPKPQIKSTQTHAVTIQQQVNYQTPGLIALLASLVCLFLAKPGTGRGPSFSRITSAKFRWSIAAVLVVLAYATGFVFPLHLALEQVSLLRYVVLAIAIFVATLSSPSRLAPSEMVDGEVQVEYVTGRVRNFEKRSEGGGQNPQSIWSFLLEAYDDNGNSLRPVPVEIRSQFIRGVLADGNEVEILKVDRQGALFIPNAVFNRTTQSWIYTDSGAKNNWRSLIFLILFPIIGLPMLCGVLYLAIKVIMMFAGQK